MEPETSLVRIGLFGYQPLFRRPAEAVPRLVKFDTMLC